MISLQLVTIALVLITLVVLCMIIGALTALQAQTFFTGEIEMAALDDLEAEVAAETTVEGSAVLLLQRLGTELQGAINANDPARIQAITTALKQNADTLAAAVTAGTTIADAAAPPPATQPPAPTGDTGNAGTSASSDASQTGTDARATSVPTSSTPGSDTPAA
jgi:hypothetical protein